jgi:hypothetical protein
MNLLLAMLLFAIVFSGIGVQTATTTIAAVNQCVLPQDRPRPRARRRSRLAGRGGRHPAR